MELNNLVNLMTVDIYQRLLTAVELGKWPDGVVLTPEQKENSLQAIMLWQARHNHDAQHMTVGTDGNIILKTKDELKRLFDSEQQQ
ncbi:transcriptional regulator [Arsenophonus endosymbiont of Bemisia tabaci Asia II 3]|nr:transcriptional regulator [Arsenophonus endosymbiont of Bemisia tabaci Asia II 3]